ncbi:MAG TPA: beta-ketoacyl-ACP synthase III [Actinomycetota bacterium]|nr:beta-ketoacyl-ACP synthase III [Actinomycetota bacterium]
MPAASSRSGAAVLGCGMAVPDRVLTNLEFEQMFDTTDEWIRTRTGIEQRRIAAPNEATATFATAAGAHALKEAGLTPDDLDLILVATCTPDMPVPGSAPLVQASLGAGSAGAFDINAGCTGFISALAMGTSAVESGLARHVLVCGADTLSRITNYTDRRTAVLFGDGAGAVVLGASTDEPRVGPFVMGCEGERWDLLHVPAGGSQRPAGNDTVAEHGHTIRMKGQDVYKHACDRMTQAAREVLGEIPVDSVDLVVAHQANGRIIRTVQERLGLRHDQVVDNVARYGNTSAASIPIALSESIASGRLRDGMRVVLVAFGAGFSWAAALVKWGPS